ncbi:MAG: ABC transporter permease [Limimaricola sp.]|uniref:ABC transporter permease n=1 Tax=Limimaricola sp. TaxID=2211665 RepID=UPI001D33D15E|nr:ABC transporter permease [Limimaricola sp.]MBI1417855.1 ABC transporter permease [Limimaricola sp.]
MLSRLTRLSRRPEFGALIGVITVYLFFAIATHGNGFVTVAGTAGWLNTASELGIVAIPVAMLMIAGEFDLSIGSVIGATSILLAIGHSTYHVPIEIMILAALLMGVGVGLFNGIVTTRTRLPSFIVTLVSLLSLSGAALGLSRMLAGTPNVSLRVDGYIKQVFASHLGNANISIAWWLAISAVAWWVLSRTRAGNWVLATGGEKNAAREAGVPTDRVKISLFVATALGAVLVGIIQTLEFNGGEATRGQVYVFNSIIASVIGGVFLQGGYGSAFGVTLGTMTYGIVSLGIYYTGWNADWAQLLLGILLLIAVLANNLFQKLALRG